MTKRLITDEEVALIKAMLGRGMMNRDIRFFFNRPDRAVNPGRIIGIANQAYSDIRRIAPATDAVLNFFLKERDPASRPLDASLPRRPTMPPMAVLRGMFSRTTRRCVWQLSDGETDMAECKATFGLRHTGKWLRAVAALANNCGGCIFFGVADKDERGAHLVTGIDAEAFLGVDAACATAVLLASAVATLATSTHGAAATIAAVAGHGSEMPSLLFHTVDALLTINGRVGPHVDHVIVGDYRHGIPNRVIGASPAILAQPGDDKVGQLTPGTTYMIADLRRGYALLRGTNFSKPSAPGETVGWVRTSELRFLMLRNCL